MAIQRGAQEQSHRKHCEIEARAGPIFAVLGLEIEWNEPGSGFSGLTEALETAQIGQHKRAVCGQQHVTGLHIGMPEAERVQIQ